MLLVPGALAAQQPDSMPRDTLPAIVVSATRADRPLSRTAAAVSTVSRADISAARPTLGLDEALGGIPGVVDQNRYNFSLDQRLSIRGAVARAAFAIRGIKVLLDGIPQTLPDGQGQLTNLDLSEVNHIEVERGSASALFGNATGGVISIWTDPTAPSPLSEDARLVAGQFYGGRTWSKWSSTTRARVGAGSLMLTAARLSYQGERNHSAADQRDLNSRLRLPLSDHWSLAGVVAYGDDPRADNPGALTNAELHANADSAAPVNLSRNAGKAVTQGQGGVTLRRAFDNGGEADATVFGFTRDLNNPQTFAFIRLKRLDYGARFTLAQPFSIGSFPQVLTTGFDVQRTRDDRVNFNYVGTTSAADTSRQLDQLEHVTEVGPFVQSAVTLTSRLTATAGLRYDWVSFQVDDRLVDSVKALTNPIYLNDSGRRLMRAFSASLGAAFAASERLTVYVNTGSSFETPTTTELANRPDTLGGFNPLLQPQRAWNTEVGARGEPSERLRWTAAVFQTDVHDELIPFQEPSSPQRMFYRNAGSARHRGVELGADASPVSGLRLSLTYTYSHFRYMDYRYAVGATTYVLDGRPLAGVPEHWLRALVGVHPWGLSGAWLEVETVHASSQLLNDALSTRAGGWWRSDARVGWGGSVGGVRLEPFLAVQNLFNHHYVGSVTVNAAAGRYYEPAPGRSFYLGLEVH
ncbi:MAG TPA: TonB-dependent receptor [Gemmatimonadales bacterium]|nr:TonB-dependent receptor [Gemmatimonadales bacterium]